MHIDLTSGHRLPSFMDGFSGYNQIKIVPNNAEKTAFHTPVGNFHYTVMPFGLKNAEATYQRVMIAVFHYMMGKKVEDYDLVVRSYTRDAHWLTLKKEFGRCLKYNLKMNPKKCAFGMLVGKFLGLLVHQRGLMFIQPKSRISLLRNQELKS